MLFYFSFGPKVDTSFGPPCIFQVRNPVFLNFLESNFALCSATCKGLEGGGGFQETPLSTCMDHAEQAQVPTALL